MTRSRTPLVNSLVSGDRQGVGGILCNDSSGLCLSSKGEIDSSNSGVYTNLVRLASQLQQQGEATDSAPLITIETDASALLVKEYDGHAVALRVPSTSAAKEATDAEETSSDDPLLGSTNY
jgi:hypothetical protein